MFLRVTLLRGHSSNPSPLALGEKYLALKSLGELDFDLSCTGACQAGRSDAGSAHNCSYLETKSLPEVGLNNWARHLRGSDNEGKSQLPALTRKRYTEEIEYFYIATGQQSASHQRLEEMHRIPKDLTAPGSRGLP
ncbi:hypothetical protein NDU88_012434 [Pleurodeles waltl]|uniref:Uncharacterized protein n=1 Tax=Pleurodeles waltl TaxID=8319 RepID=A0AAV7R1F5_PLEWA|nr:hypothetical protein NDU88_012434 [Pleurodeles waltl]